MDKQGTVARSVALHWTHNPLMILMDFNALSVAMHSLLGRVAAVFRSYKAHGVLVESPAQGIVVVMKSME